MCASTYTLNFNSLLNIINATQLPDQLSLGIHRHWRGRADSMRCSTAISEFGFVFFNAAAAAAKAKRTKQLKWCRGRKASPAVLLCCSSWKLDPSQSTSEQKCNFFDVSIKELSVKEAECFCECVCVCVLTPSSRRGNSLGADSTGGDGS